MSAAYPPPPPPPPFGRVPTPGFAAEAQKASGGLIVGLVVLLMVLDLLSPLAFWFDVATRTPRHLPQPVYYGLAALPVLVLIPICAVIAPDQRRRAVAAALAAGALVATMLGSLLNDFGSVSMASRTVFGVRAAIIGTLVVAAWQVARRHGTAWVPWAGLVPLLVLVETLTIGRLSTVIIDVTDGLGLGFEVQFLIVQLTFWAVGLVPLFAAVLAGAAADRR